tara:strand:- start:31570 stop:31833 length:264 start_codon:yes stop_codon:yes gene_type:complete
MSVQKKIYAKLSEAFSPEFLRVEDESHLHEGHAGFKPGGETHFRISITSSIFSEKSRIEQQRMIYKVLSDEMNNQVHALTLSIRVSD